MYQIIEHVVASVSIGAITLTTIFAFFGQKFFEHILQRNVEILKVEITQAAQINKDKLSSYFQVKFERLLKFYDTTSKLMNAVAGVGAFYKSSGGLSEKSIEMFSERYAEFTSAITYSQPFLAEDILRQATSITTNLEVAIISFRSSGDEMLFVRAIAESHSKLILLSQRAAKIINSI